MNTFNPKWTENQLTPEVIKNIQVYGTDYVKNNKQPADRIHSQKVDILTDNLDAKNMLTSEESTHRKQEFLKSNIFNEEKTKTFVKDKFETGKNKVIEDKVFDVYTLKTMENKRHELDTHFTIGDNVDFVNYSVKNTD